MKLKMLSGLLTFIFILNQDFVMAYTKKESDCRKLYELTKEVDPNCKDVLDSNGNIISKKSVIKIEEVYVEGGTFQMGDTFGDGYSSEKPVHSVKVDSFYIGKYEVTQKEYKAVMGSNTSRFKGNNLPVENVRLGEFIIKLKKEIFKGDNLPVENVSFNEAVKFCNKYNKLKGLPEAYDINGNIINWRSYRLPTEAEWEYAARGGNKSKGYKYSGSNKLGEVAWYILNSSSKTHPVGTKKPNELGIYDMSGNVWEWVSDWYDENYYNNSNTINPYNNNNNKSASDRVNRGGSWIHGDDILRVSIRRGDSPVFSSSDQGLRLIRTAP